MAAVSETAMLSAQMRYQFTLDKESLERSYSHRHKAHLAACSLCLLPGSDLQPIAGTGGVVKEGNWMLKHLAAYYRMFYM